MVGYLLPHDSIIDDVCVRLEFPTKVAAGYMIPRDPDSEEPVSGVMSVGSVIERGWGATDTRPLIITMSSRTRDESTFTSIVGLIKHLD